MKRQRLDTGGKRRVGVAILGPAIHLQQKIARPSGRGRRRGRKLEPDFVARAHDGRPVVHIAQQLAHVAIARIQARRRIPERVRRNTVVEECIGLFPLRIDPRPRESTEIEAGGEQRNLALTHLGLRRPFAEEDLVPIHADAGHDPHLAAGGWEPQFHRDRLGLAGRHSHVFVHGLPLPGGVLHLEVWHNQAALHFLRGGAECAAIGPIHPAVEQQEGAAVQRGLAEIQLQRVRRRHAQFGARKLIGVLLVARQQARQYVAPRLVARRLRIDAPLDAEQTELGIRRPLEFLVGEYLGRGGMVHGQ